MKRSAGYTLVELLVAIALLSLIGLLAGRLVTGSLQSWRREADVANTIANAQRTLDALAADLDRAPRGGFIAPEAPAEWTLAADGDLLPLWIAGSDGALHAVAWVARGVDGSSIELWRIEMDAASTRVALPANAAALAAAAQPNAGPQAPAPLLKQCVAGGVRSVSCRYGSISRLLEGEFLTQEGFALISAGQLPQNLPNALLQRVARPLLVLR